MLTNALGVQYDVNGNPVAGAPGSAVPGAAVYVAGTDGTNLRGLLTDNTGKLLVTFSPSDATGSGTLNALNAAATVTMAGEVGAGFVLAAGTLIGTIVPEISYDNTNWVTTYFIDPTTGAQASSIVFAANNGLTQKTIYVPDGAGFARVRVSAYTSGTAAATIRASMVNAPTQLSAAPTGTTAPAITTAVGGLNGGNIITLAVDASGREIVVGAAATGAAPSGNPVYVAGFDGTNVQPLRTDTSGRQIAVGAAASGAAAVGNPVLIAGATAGGNAQSLLVDTQGRIIMIDEKASTAAITSVAASASNVSLLASNANRLGATIVNDGNSKLYVAMGATASLTAYTVLVPAGGYYEVPFDYTGAINGIWASANGNARITEFTN